MVGQQPSQSGQLGEEESIVPLKGIEPRISQRPTRNLVTVPMVPCPTQKPKISHNIYSTATPVNRPSFHPTNQHTQINRMQGSDRNQSTPKKGSLKLGCQQDTRKA